MVFVSRRHADLPPEAVSLLGACATHLGPFLSPTEPLGDTGDEAAREREKGLVEFLDRLPFAAFLKDDRGHYLYANGRYGDLLGVSAEEMIGRTTEQITTPDLAAQAHADDAEVMSSGKVVTMPEYVVKTASGERRAVSFTKIPYVRPSTGRPAIIGIAIDVSDLRRAREALRASEAHKAALMNAAPDLMFRLSADGVYLDYHAPHPEELLTRPEEFLGHSVDEICPQHVARLFRQNIVETIRTGRIQTFEYQLDIPAIGPMDFELRMAVNDRREVVTTVRNITARKRIERDLETRLRYESALAECSQELLQGSDEPGVAIPNAIRHLLDATGTGRVYIFENFQHERDGLCCRQTYEVCAQGVPSESDNEVLRHTSYEEWIPRWADLLSDGMPVMGSVADFPESERRVLEPQGIVSILVLPLAVGGKWHGFLGLDDTSSRRQWSDNDLKLLRTAAHMLSAYLERVDTEDRLRDGERKFREFAENVKEVFWLRSGEGFTYISPAFRDVWGRDPESLIVDPMAFDSAVHPEDRERVRERFTALLRLSAPCAEEFRIVRPDGSVRWIWARSFPVSAERGAFRSVGIAEDITDRKRAQEEKEMLQRQFLQAQKMEVIGRLAGGVAHDFNNLLLPIMGYADMGLLQIESGNPLHGDLQQIRDAAERAAGLTRQLLSFSRKQVLDMKTVCLNTVVDDFTGMIRRSIGEGIALDMDLAEDLGTIKADPGQIEQVIMNLTINARDAMNEGGTLRVVTRNTVLDEAFVKNHTGMKPGRFVMLQISDTGHGMDAETRTKLFEPFFTTKERSKGTGLGLATVYGIVKQHAGTIWVESEPGEGATFTVYFPRLHEGGVTRPRQAVQEGVNGTETVLVVEDEDMARELVENILLRYGYDVVALPGPQEAIDFVENFGGHIDLLVTDIIMPQMNGNEMYHVLKGLRPDLNVLFMSGYTGDVIMERGLIEEGQPLLRKPFTVRGLTQMVRDAIDGKQPAGS